jgi:hypothetical protein
MIAKHAVKNARMICPPCREFSPPDYYGPQRPPYKRRQDTRLNNSARSASVMSLRLRMNAPGSPRLKPRGYRMHCRGFITSGCPKYTHFGPSLGRNLSHVKFIEYHYHSRWLLHLGYGRTRKSQTALIEPCLLRRLRSWPFLCVQNLLTCRCGSIRWCEHICRKRRLYWRLTDEDRFDRRSSCCCRCRAGRCRHRNGMPCRGVEHQLLVLSEVDAHKRHEAVR